MEGGDAAWEEKNQGSGYAKSEVRFIEIEEDLCKDIDRGETQVGDSGFYLRNSFSGIAFN